MNPSSQPDNREQMFELNIGDRVMHDFSEVYGTITGKRAKRPYRYRVLWDGEDFKEDWYERKVLVRQIINPQKEES